MSRSLRFKSLEVPPGHIFRTVRLFFKCATAAAVSITGDFCNHQTRRLPLRRDPHRIWRIQLLLTPGRYRYQFIVDRRWLNDPRSCGTNPRCPDGPNCALRIE
ncbi:MAG: hypothetical protein HY674_14665 [Chloroflexi bacterium]|nr:hypothetical protein [Chloroflexota bacterium]